MSMPTRRATPQDADQLALLFDDYRVFYKQASDIAAAKQFLSQRFARRDSVILVATDGEQIIGFTQLYPTFSSVSMRAEYILNDLFVSPGHRKRGVGKQLLDAAKIVTRQQNMKGLALATALDNPAQFLYEKEGWVKDDEFLHYYWVNSED
jgi:GNAT superfamily N-acetyltransferase